MADHFSAMNSFIKSADYLTAKPVKKRSSGNAFGISRRKDYTSEEKLFFVNLVVEGGNSKASVAKQYDIPESTLRGWCKPKHKDKLEKEAHERKTAPNVFDTPSPSSSSSSAGSGVTPALYHPYKDSPFDPHPAISSASIVPTLQIPKVESLYYPQQTLRCRSAMGDARPLIKEEQYEEVLNLSNKTEHHLSSPILTQCLNSIPSIKTEVSPSNSLKSMQHMKHSLLDIKSPNNLMDIHQNISSMFQSYSKSPQPPFSSDPTCKLSPKPSNSPSPVQYSHQDKVEDVNVNKRKFDAFVNDVNKDVSSSSSALELYRKDSQVNNNNNSDFYKNYEQYLNIKRSSEVYSKLEPKRDVYSSSPGDLTKAEPPAPSTPMNPYFKSYLETMVKAQKLPGAPSTTAGPEQFKLATQQLWLQQLALNQLAASSMTQLPNAMQQQTAAALQQQQLLYERQLMNSRLNQQGGGHADEKLYTWTSQLHANQRELEEKLKLLIQTQQQILSDKNQSPPEVPAPDTDRVKRMRTMNVRDILESHRQNLENSREMANSHERLQEVVDRPTEERREEALCVQHIEEDAEKEEVHSLDLTKSVEPSRLESPRHAYRTSPPVQELLNRISESPLPDSETRLAYHEHSEIRYKIDSEHNELQFKSASEVSETRYQASVSELRCKPDNELIDSRYESDNEFIDSRHEFNNEQTRSNETEQPRYDETKKLDHNEGHLDSAIQHGEQFLEDLEKVSHPKLTLQHIRQLRDLLVKLRAPVENNNFKDVLEDVNCKSKRKSLLNIVHNLTN